MSALSQHHKTGGSFSLLLPLGRFVRRLSLVCLSAATTAALPAAEDLAVLKPSPDGTPPAQQLEKWLMAGLNRMVAARSAAFEEAIKSRAACEAWQRERRAFFLERIGGLPERTPLNPRITGTLSGKGYRVEKIILETRPGFHLTANLYLPDTPPPWPAVLVACGHSHDGKAAGGYQFVSRLLARHGMAALCYDPIGQGERYQLLDTAKEHAAFEDAPRYPSPHPAVRLTCTTEHTMTGLGCALLGANVAQFEVRAAGSIERDGCTIQKLILTTEPGLDLPALAFMPKAKASPREPVLYLHGGSMKADAAPGGPIEALVQQGRVVLAAELRGLGETEARPRAGRTDYGRGRFGPDLLDVFTAYLMGRSHVGMRCDDTLRWLRHLQSGALTGGAPAGIELIATGESAIPALHAAALRPAAFRRITLRRLIPSWESLVDAGETFDQAVNIVHGALRHYDLPDLARFIPVEKITLAEPMDGLGRAVP